MPPRVPRQVADAIGRSASSTRCGGSGSNSSISNASSRLLLPSTPLSSSSSSSSTVFQRSSTRAILARSFTCSSCRSQQHQKQKDAAVTDRGSSRSEELHATTQPADHGGRSPMPQRRLPRWAETPQALRAPFSVRKNEPANRFAVNEDPARLDQAYEAVFGTGGAQLLPAEVKWLAVTHKSFDQGRRGFNDRLAFVGKRLVDLQTSLAVLAQRAPTGTTNAKPNTAKQQEESTDTVPLPAAQQGGEALEAELLQSQREDAFGREIFQHPVMDILPKLTHASKFEHTEVRKLALLAREFGLQAVVRWKPRQASDLLGSGQDATLVQALYAMVGALAMQRGGDVAVKAVRARILPRLGLRV